jgi:hypothetical protein
LIVLDFGLKIDRKTQEENLFKISQNRLLGLVELIFNYANWGCL